MKRNTIQKNIQPEKASSKHREILDMRKALMQAEKLRRAGKLKESEKLCRQLLARDPKYMAALQTFGLISLERSNFPQAVTCFLTATATAPEDASNYLNLAAAWMGLENPAMAEFILERAHSLQPDNAEIHHLKGDVYVRNREYEQAMASFSKAIEMDANHVLSKFKLADTYVNLGYFAEARDILVELNKAKPDWIGVINLLHHLPSGMVDLDFEYALRNAKKQESETEAEFKNSKKFVEASILDRKGKFESAWQILIDANQEVHDNNTENIKKTNAVRKLEHAAVFKQEIIERNVINVETVPLFILGPSRAGKTTLEVLLASSPDVKRGYENLNVQKSTLRAAQISGLVNIEQLWRLPGKLLPEFANDFRIRIAKQSRGKRILTNTSPGLISNAAHIASAIPEARFIFIHRDFDDLTLRILMKKYKRSNYQCYSLETIREYIEWYSELSEELIFKLGDRALKMSYENLVTDTFKSTNAALKLCGSVLSEKVNIPKIASDIGCSKPYSSFLAK